jgi:Nucleotidyl transferase AbiEii toxin, Type IV TA system
MSDYNYPNPNTHKYSPNPDRDPRMQRSQIFDPALRQFSHRAFRLGDPIFQDPEIAQRWFEARQQVIDYLLLSIQGSRWNEHLVLRGSLLLKAWLGDTAREPNDIDWVFRPEHTQLKDRLAQQLFDELIQLVREYPQVGNVIIDSAKVVTDEIWTYDRSNGRRILFPWQADGLPSGTLQMDVAFGERLCSDPVLTPIPTSWDEDIFIWSASKELSLAWKLRWLETDSFPQGKDLYDATLLAEQTQLPFELLRQVLESSEDWTSNVKNWVPNFSWKSGYPWSMEPTDIEWDNFILEYPWVEGDAQSWLDRLSRALIPTFANLEI